MSELPPAQFVRFIEEALVKAFIVSAKRERYRTLLAHPTRRVKILQALNYCHDFDPRYATPIASNTPCIAALLRSRGAPERCHVIAWSEPDGLELPLDDAIFDAELHGAGALIGCVPGRLAYYYGEMGEQRLLLERHT